MTYAPSSDETSHTSEGIHYHEWGTGQPLLLLHGSGPGVSAWSNFGGNVGSFGERFHVIAPDLPGYGKSFIPEDLDRPYPLLAAQELLAFAQRIGMESAHLLGNSMGGAVAAQLTLLEPQLVERLVMMGPGGLGVSVFSPLPSEGIRRLMEFNEEPTRERLVAWLQTMVYDRSLITEELVDERFKMSQRPGVVDWSRRTYDAIYTRPPQGFAPLWTQAAKISVPTLITWGRDDRIVPLDNALLPMRMIPRAELHVFPQCGHWAMIERKVEFESVVTAFLTRPTRREAE